MDIDLNQSDLSVALTRVLVKKVSGGKGAAAEIFVILP
jgi:hypothetical protein